jgi:hypothetical protein
VVEVLPGVGLLLTNGHRRAGVERVRGKRVASAETVGTGAALAIFCIS